MRYIPFLLCHQGNVLGEQFAAGNIRLYTAVNGIEHNAYPHASRTGGTGKRCIAEIDIVLRSNGQPVKRRKIPADFAVQDSGRHIIGYIGYTDGTSQTTNAAHSRIVEFIVQARIVQRPDIAVPLVRKGHYGIVDQRIDLALFLDHSYTCAYTCASAGHAQGIGIAVQFTMMVSLLVKAATETCSDVIHSGFRFRSEGIDPCAAHDTSAHAGKADSCHMRSQPLPGRCFQIHISGLNIIICTFLTADLRPGLPLDRSRITAYTCTCTLTGSTYCAHHAISIGIIMCDDAEIIIAFGQQPGFIHLGQSAAANFIHVKGTIDCCALTGYAGIDQQGFDGMRAGRRHSNPLIGRFAPQVSQICGGIQDFFTISGTGLIVFILGCRS